MSIGRTKSDRKMKMEMSNEHCRKIKENKEGI